jgi:NADH-quinone oxidoreductase subunit L
MALAVMAALIGLLNWLTKFFGIGGATFFDSFLARSPSVQFFERPNMEVARALANAAHGGGHGWIQGVSVLIAILGISAAAFLYLGEPSEIKVLSREMQLRGNPRLAGMSPYKLSSHKFFFDEIYYYLIVRPLELLADVSYWFDRKLIDGAVNLVGRMPAALGAVMRSLQMGLVQFYALAMIIGVLILAAVRLWARG